jgi:hypothetical protein
LLNGIRQDSQEFFILKMAEGEGFPFPPAPLGASSRAGHLPFIRHSHPTNWDYALRHCQGGGQVGFKSLSEFKWRGF